ncbi:MAG: aldo/keto reductase [Candidatus Omnitrophica bacterium]|nr:aldo/keto reductase [Candidatus Omnitrophota bacterium]
MKTIRIGTSELVSTRLAYGCWRLTETSRAPMATGEGDECGRRAVIAAYEAGYTLFDHADIYGGGKCESLFGEVLGSVPGMRDRILVATKCGIRLEGEPGPGSPHRYDFSASHIIASCERSLKRLGIETIDLYQLHRPDYLADPEEVATAFSRLRQAGKVREFGLSNFRPSLVAALQKACPMPLIVHQVEISLARLDCFTDGTLDQCLTEKMTPLAWSPLAGGSLGSRADNGENARPTLNAVLEVLGSIARDRGMPASAIALAWLLKHPGGIIPIVGSTNPDRIRAAAKADDVDLTRDEWYRLLLAARGEDLP